jgi:hypothetical protein
MTYVDCSLAGHFTLALQILTNYYTVYPRVNLLSKTMSYTRLQ